MRNVSVKRNELKLLKANFRWGIEKDNVKLIERMKKRKEDKPKCENSNRKNKYVKI